MFSNQEFEVQKPKKIFNKLELRDIKKLSSTVMTSLPTFGDKAHLNFNSLWSAVISLDRRVFNAKEIWLVQNQDEARTSTLNKRRFLEAVNPSRYFQRLDFSKVKQSDIFELVAYAAGLWIFLT